MSNHESLCPQNYDFTVSKESLPLSSADDVPPISLPYSSFTSLDGGANKKHHRSCFIYNNIIIYNSYEHSSSLVFHLRSMAQQMPAIYKQFIDPSWLINLDEVHSHFLHNYYYYFNPLWVKHEQHKNLSIIIN